MAEDGDVAIPLDRHRPAKLLAKESLADRTSAGPAAFWTVRRGQGKVRLVTDLARRAKLGIKTHDVRESWLALTLLGLVPLSEDNWGVMLNLAWTRGAIFSKDSVFYIMAPIAAIALFQLGLVAMNRSLSEIFDPRLRRGS